MNQAEAAAMYLDFVSSVNRTGFAYSMQATGTPQALLGPIGAIFPLSPTKLDAESVIAANWPNLRAYRLTRRSLLVRLPILAVQGVPVGISMAGCSEGVLAEAMQLHHDLADEHAA